ncbi:MAG: murein L,D-transpeptidase catalytic domain family protein, partial [Proteobacteria bacterium]
DEGDEPVSEEDLEKGRQNIAGIAAPPAAQQAAAGANHANVDKEGVVPSNLKSQALAYMDANPGKFASDYMVVIDMGKHSKEERFYLIDLNGGSVSKTVVAHGSGSDPSNTGTPTRFSNTNNSKMTSLGVYKTGEVYQSGKVGRAVRLDGLESTNNAARARGVVFHASNYVSRGRAKQGRSYGCPAVPANETRALQDKIANGRLFVIGQGGPETADSCAGKADGYYCSDVTPNIAYNCRSTQQAGVAHCPDSSKKCKAGSNRQATLSGGQLTCE